MEGGMKTTVCCWCLAPVKVRNTFDERTQKVVCSQGCKDAELLFCLHYSDEEINRRAHYRFLTEGKDGTGEKTKGQT